MNNFSRSNKLFFLRSVYPTYRILDQQQLKAAENHVRVGPMYRRTNLIQSGFQQKLLQCSGTY